MRASHTITPLFDDPNLVGSAGLVPALRLAESAGLYDLLAEHLSVESPNRVAKAGCVIAGIFAGADSIDDLDVLRHGASLALLPAWIASPAAGLWRPAATLSSAEVRYSSAFLRKFLGLVALVGTGHQATPLFTRGIEPTRATPSRGSHPRPARLRPRAG